MKIQKKHTGKKLQEGSTSLSGYLITLLIIFLFSLLISMINWQHGEGEKIGQIVKLSKVGFINETVEGQLIRGGMNNGSGAFGTEPFNFTVPSPMAETVREYMKNQTEVIIHYEIAGLYSPFSSGSKGHFLLWIEPNKPASVDSSVKK